ncbi:MAG: hypothetical protein Q9213_000344 [Squamulea squamosa]
MEPSAEAKARWAMLASLAGVSSKARPADEGPSSPAKEERKTASGNPDLQNRDPDHVEDAINDKSQDVRSGSQPHHKLIMSACPRIEPSGLTLRKDSIESQNRPTDDKAESLDNSTGQPQEDIDPYYTQGPALSPLGRAYWDSVEWDSEPGFEPNQLSAGDNVNGRKSPNEHLSDSRLANEDGREAEDINVVRYSTDISHPEQGQRQVESNVAHMGMNTSDKVGCETTNVARVRSAGPKKESWNEETWVRQPLSQLPKTTPSTKPSPDNRQTVSLRDSPNAAHHSPQNQFTAAHNLDPEALSPSDDEVRMYHHGSQRPTQSINKDSSSLMNKRNPGDQDLPPPKSPHSTWRNATQWPQYQEHAVLPADSQFPRRRKSSEQGVNIGSKPTYAGPKGITGTDAVASHGEVLGAERLSSCACGEALDRKSPCQIHSGTFSNPRLMYHDQTLERPVVEDQHTHRDRGRPTTESCLPLSESRSRSPGVFRPDQNLQTVGGDGRHMRRDYTTRPKNETHDGTVKYQNPMPEHALSDVKSNQPDSIHSNYNNDRHDKERSVPPAQLEQYLHIFKQQAQAVIGEPCDNPGFIEQMLQLLFKIGEDALPEVQRILGENPQQQRP